MSISIVKAYQQGRGAKDFLTVLLRGRDLSKQRNPWISPVIEGVIAGAVPMIVQHHLILKYLGFMLENDFFPVAAITVGISLLESFVRPFSGLNGLVSSSKARAEMQIYGEKYEIPIDLAMNADMKNRWGRAVESLNNKICRNAAAIIEKGGQADEFFQFQGLVEFARDLTVPEKIALAIKILDARNAIGDFLSRKNDSEKHTGKKSVAGAIWINQKGEISVIKKTASHTVEFNFDVSEVIRSVLSQDDQKVKMQSRYFKKILRKLCKRLGARSTLDYNKKDYDLVVSAYLRLLSEYDAARSEKESQRNIKKRNLKLAMAISAALHAGGIGIYQITEKSSNKYAASESANGSDNEAEKTVSDKEAVSGPMKRVRPKDAPEKLRAASGNDSEQAFFDLTNASGAMTGIRPEVTIRGLKIEEDHLIQNTLNALHEGNLPMAVSRFLIKSEILEENIRRLEKGDKYLVDEQAVIDQYNAILNEAKGWIAGIADPAGKIDALYRFMHYRQLRAYQRDHGKFSDILIGGLFNCQSSTLLLTALQDDLLKDNNLGPVLFDSRKNGLGGHMNSWFKDAIDLWQIENTFGGLPAREHFKTGLIIPKEGIYAAYLIRMGIKIDKLPKSLRDLYIRGVSGGGYPVAGVETDLPDPPEDIIPNPFFGKKKPEEIYALSEINKNGKEMREKQIKTLEIIKQARIDAMTDAFFQEQTITDPSSISLSIINIPRNVDWCKIDSDGMFLNGPLEENIDFSRQVRHMRNYYYGIYQLFVAEKVAGIYAARGDNNYAKCTPKQHRINAISNMLAVDGMSINDMKINYDDEVETADLFLGIYRSKKYSKELRSRAFGYLLFRWPESLNFDDLMRELNDRDQHDIVLQYLMNKKQLAPKEAEEAKDEIIRLYQRPIFYERDDYTYKYAILHALANLGFGKIVLNFIEKRLPAESERGYKIYLLRKITRLHPDKVMTEEDRGEIWRMVREEKDPVARACLVAILAKNEKDKKVPDYLENEVVNLLKGKMMPDRFDKVIYSLGDIQVPGIEKLLLMIYKARPEYVVEIADGLYKNGIHLSQIVEGLKKVLFNIKEEPERRRFAAYLLIQMGELSDDLYYD